MDELSESLATESLFYRNQQLIGVREVKEDVG